jgi:surfactin synthase thioesterase subunit
MVKRFWRGRESRIRDAPIESPWQIVDQVAEAVRAAELVKPTSVLVGVCSDALLMFEIARALHGDDRPLGGLVAVSQSAPHRHEPQRG